MRQQPWLPPRGAPARRLKIHTRDMAWFLKTDVVKWTMGPTLLGFP